MLTKSINTKISCLLIFMMLACFVIPTSGRVYANDCKNKFYFNGVEYLYNQKANGEIRIETAKDGGKHFIQLDEDGDGKCVADSSNDETESYSLSVWNLSKDNIDIEMKSEEGKNIEVKNFKELDKLDNSICSENEYRGQAAIISVGVISLGALIKVLLAVTATMILAGVTYYVAAKAYDKIKSRKQKKKQFFPASIYRGSVYVAANSPISRKKATSRIKAGKSFYAFSSSNARSAIKATGWGCTKKRNSSKKRKNFFLSLSS